MIRLALISICLFMMLLSCNNNSISSILDEKTIPTDTIYVSNSTEKFDAKDIFDSVEVITLKSNPEMGIASVGKLICYDKKFFVWDPILNDVFVFDDMGYPIAKFENPNKSVEFNNVVLHKKSNSIYSYNLKSAGLVTYDFKGRKIREVPVSIDFNHFDIVENSFVFVKNYTRNSKGKFDNMEPLIEIRDFTLERTEASLFEYDPNAIYKSDIFDHKLGLFHTANNNEIIYTRFGDLSFYTLDNTGGIKKTKVALDSNYYNAIDDDFLSDIKYKGRRIKYLNNNDNNFCFMEWILKTNSGTILKVNSLQSAMVAIILSDKTIPISNISYTTDMLGGIPFLFSNYIASDQEYYYCYFTSKHFLDLLNNLPYLGHVLKNYADIAELYKNINVMSNGYIIKFRIKPQQ